MAHGQVGPDGVDVEGRCEVTFRGRVATELRLGSAR
jgi:hypothetical protein